MHSKQTNKWFKCNKQKDQAMYSELYTHKHTHIHSRRCPQMEIANERVIDNSQLRNYVCAWRVEVVKWKSHAEPSITKNEEQQQHFDAFSIETY